MIVDLEPMEAIRAHSALEASIARMRQFCRETDAKYGDMNDIYRDAIAGNKRTSAKLLAALREAGYPMTDAEILDLPIDDHI